MDASDIPVEAKEGLWVGCVVKSRRAHGFMALGDRNQECVGGVLFELGIGDRMVC